MPPKLRDQICPEIRLSPKRKPAIKLSSLDFGIGVAEETQMTDKIKKRCLSICPLFEAELLVRLMLINWEHPLAQDESFRQGLLESATELLIAASDESCTDVFI